MMLLIENYTKFTYGLRPYLKYLLVSAQDTLCTTGEF